MGNGAISREEGGELMKQLNSEYAKYSTMGYSDDIVMQKLEEKFNIFYEKKGIANRPIPVNASKPPPSAQPPAKASATRKTQVNSKKGGATRRRSFDPSTQSTGPASDALLTSRSTQALPAGEQATEAPDKVQEGVPEEKTDKNNDTKDHWDSVSEQPYCHVCKMGFKTEGLLKKHTKYSQMHLKAVAKLEEVGANPLAQSDAPATDALEKVGNPTDGMKRRQVEGEDYRLIYYGSKFFWRTQDNIDLSFFHHMLSESIEIVPFDVYKNKELDRVYLKYHTCVKAVEHDIETNKEMQAVKSDRWSKPTNAPEAEFEAIRKSLTTFILARLHLHDNIDTDTNTTRRAILFLPAATDDSSQEKSPLLSTKPPALIPITVTHRRNTSSEEVKNKLKEVQRDQAALRVATSRAEKVVDVIQMFAKGIKSDSARLSRMSKPRRRWIMAIKRVLQINGVAKTTKVLEELAKRDAQKSPGSRRRSHITGRTTPSTVS